MIETNTKYFDPSETIRGIQQLLVSDKKKIAFLFGAGTSFAPRTKNLPYVPAIDEMTRQIETEILNDQVYASAFNEIKVELDGTEQGFNVETLLSNIEDKIRIIGEGKLNGLTKKKLEDLYGKVKDLIREAVSIHIKFDENDRKQLIQHDFAKWIKSADRKSAIEIFTTNYDYLFEIGLEEAEVPYYDGFTGSYLPFFNPSSLEDLSYLPRQTKLWKIHGSLGLQKVTSQSKSQIVRTNSDVKDLLIYPSMLKYSNSKKMPYSAFMDRLNDFLKQDDTVLFTCGYSFADEHINERILSALDRNTTSHVFILYYDVVWDDNHKKYALTPDCKLTQMALANRKISILGTRHAVIGSKYGTWNLMREPDKNDPLNVDLYFDADAPYNPDIEIGAEQKQNERWTGEGDFVLPDFTKFIKFLRHMIPKSEWEGLDYGDISNKDR